MYPLLRQKRPNLEGKTTIRATNEDGLAIGFLLGRSSESGTDWERIGFDPDPSDGSSATWTPDNGGSGPVTIAAVPCLALSEPSEAVATKVFAIGPGKLSQASEPLQPTPGAREAACNTTPVPSASSSTTGAESGGCDPSYPDVCLRVNAGDYDCAGGSGDGPNYVTGPIRVRPPDRFALILQP